MSNTDWSDYIQNPNFLDSSRITLLNRDSAEFTVKKLGLTLGMRVLDIGCGTGAFGYHLGLVTSGVSYIGLDRDSRLIAAAKEKPSEDSAGNSYSFVEADASKLPFEDNSFDVVVSHTFLTASWEYEEAFREMIRVCRVDGIVSAVNISDFSKIIHHEPNRAAADSFPYERYKVLSERFDRAVAQIFPITARNSGIEPENVPEFFEKNGLSGICVYPIGTFFSLHNDEKALSQAEKKRQTELMKAALLEKIERFSNLRGFDRYFSADESLEYMGLIEQYYDSIPDHDWNYDALLYLLVLGKKDPEQIVQKNDPDASFAVYRKNKYKDSVPEKTLAQLQKLWDDLGIERTESFSQGGVRSLYSCRVRLKGTDIGQNGKGTSPDYALASGYAELTERLATGFLFPFEEPDYVRMDASCVKDEGGSLLRKSLSRLYDMPLFMVNEEDLISNWIESDGTMGGYYFTGLSDGQKYFLPEFIYRDFAFTNGSCAGNTREEAMVQGLCEIMERYASTRILRKKLSPPLITDEILMEIPEIWSIVSDIRKNSDYKLFIMDASLGEDLPVVMALLVDPEEKTATVRFGAHPRIEVALERTLTELFQGKKLGEMILMKKFGAELEQTADTPANVFNIIKMGYGTVSMNLFKGISGNASWQIKKIDGNVSRQFGRWSKESFDNEAFLEQLLALCKQHSWDVFVRDCSFFDFPVYHIFVPQCSMILNFGKYSILQSQMRQKALRNLRNFPNAGQEEQLYALKTAELFSGWTLHDNLDNICKITFNAELFGVPIDSRLLKLLYDIKTKDYAAATRTLRPYTAHGEEFWCLYQILLDKEKGLELSNALSLVLHDPESFDRAQQILDDPFSVLPRCTYPDCWGCERAGKCDTFFISEKLHKCGNVKIRGKENL